MITLTVEQMKIQIYYAQKRALEYTRNIEHWKSKIKITCEKLCKQGFFIQQDDERAIFMISKDGYTFSNRQHVAEMEIILDDINDIKKRRQREFDVINMRFNEIR